MKQPVRWGKDQAPTRDHVAGALRAEAGGLRGKQARSCEARDLILGALGSHGRCKQDRKVCSDWCLRKLTWLTGENGLGDQCGSRGG